MLMDCSYLHRSHAVQACLSPTLKRIMLVSAAFMGFVDTMQSTEENQAPAVLLSRACCIAFFSARIVDKPSHQCLRLFWLKA